MNKFNNIVKLPKSLYRFYLDYGIKNYRFLMICWMVAVLVMFSGGVIWPNFQRWVVALFESPIPEGVSMVQYAMPNDTFNHCFEYVYDIGFVSTRNNCITHMATRGEPNIRGFNHIHT